MKKHATQRWYINLLHGDITTWIITLITILYIVGSIIFVGSYK